MRHIMKYDAMIDIVTLWLFNIVMEKWKMDENGPFIDG